MSGVFVSATGTGCGKTWIARGLARTAVCAGYRVAAVKPIETGGTADAEALARACGRDELAKLAGLARSRAALSPRSAELAGEPGIDLTTLATAVTTALAGADIAIVEGAGGLCTPIARGLTMADLAGALGLPLLLVAPNALGTLSHTIAVTESARRRGLAIAAVVLVAPERHDGSEIHNAIVLGEELGLRVLELRLARDDDDDLAAAVAECGLARLLALDGRRGVTG